MIRESGSWRPPPRFHAGAYTIETDAEFKITKYIIKKLHLFAKYFEKD